MAINPKAQRGHSKEKRSDGLLITLGLVLDGSGFVRRSEVFAGNVSEGQTLAGMLEGLSAPAGALIASQLPTGFWQEYIGEATLADAMLDWLLHGANRIVLTGESMRKRTTRSTDRDRSKKKNPPAGYRWASRSRSAESVATLAGICRSRRSCRGRWY